jgi:hypothetical protein
MTSQTVAFGLPMIRFVSATVIRGSTDMSEVAEAPGATAAASPFGDFGTPAGPEGYRKEDCDASDIGATCHFETPVE